MDTAFSNTVSFAHESEVSTVGPIKADKRFKQEDNMLRKHPRLHMRILNVKYKRHSSLQVPFEDFVQLEKGFEAQSGVKLNAEKAKAFVESALVSDIIYHKNRKRLWELFVTSLDPKGEIQLTQDGYTTIAGALCCRNSDFNSDKQLAFNVCTLELASMIDLFKQSKTGKKEDFGAQSGEVEQRPEPDPRTKILTVLARPLLQDFVERGWFMPVEENLPEMVRGYLTEEYWKIVDAEPEEEDEFTCQSGILKGVGSETADKVAKKVDETIEKMDEKAERHIKTLRETIEATGSSVTSTLKETVNQLSETMKRVKVEHTISEDITKITEALKAQAQSIANAASDPGKAMRILEKIVGLICAFYIVTRDVGWDIKAATSLMLISLSGVTSTIAEAFSAINVLTDTLYSFSALSCQPSDTTEAEVQTENVFLAMVNVFKNMLKVQTPTEAKVDQTRIQRFRGYITAFKSAGDVFKFVYNLIKEAFYWIYEKVFGVPYGMDMASERLHKSLLEWVDSVQEILRRDIHNEVKDDLHLLDQIGDLVKVGDEIAKAFIDCPNIRPRDNTFTDCLRSLRTLHRSLDSYRREMKPRRVPVCLQLYGPPNAGKSVLAQLISKFWVEYHGKRFGTHSIYYRNPEIRFWNNYRGQDVTICDDWWQIDDVEIRTRAAMELVSMVNDSAMPLDMAAVDDKTGTYFTSSLVIVTSNLPAVPSDEGLRLQSREAFLRRIHLQVYCTTRATLEKYGRSNMFSSDLRAIAPTSLNESLSVANLKDYVFFVTDPNINYAARTNYGLKPLSFVQLCELLIIVERRVTGDDHRSMLERLTEDTKLFAGLIKQINTPKPPPQVDIIHPDQHADTIQNNIDRKMKMLSKLTKQEETDDISEYESADDKGDAKPKALGSAYDGTSRIDITPEDRQALRAERTRNQELELYMKGIFEHIDNNIERELVNNMFRDEPKDGPNDEYQAQCGGYYDLCPEALPARWIKLYLESHKIDVKEWDEKTKAICQLNKQGTFKKMMRAFFQRDREALMYYETEMSARLLKFKETEFWNKVQLTFMEHPGLRDNLSLAIKFIGCASVLTLLGVGVYKGYKKYKSHEDEVMDMANKVFTTADEMRKVAKEEAEKLVQAVKSKPQEVILAMRDGAQAIARRGKAWLHFENPEDEAEAQSYLGRYPVHIVPTSLVAKAQTPVKLQPVETQAVAQSGHVKDIRPIVHNVIKPNLYTIIFDDDRGTPRVEQALFIMGKTCITAAHLPRYAWNKKGITLVDHKGESHKISSDELKVSLDLDRDIAFVTITKPQFRMHKNIMDHIFTDKDLTKVLGPMCTAVVLHDKEIEYRTGIMPTFTGYLKYSFKIGAKEVQCSDSVTLRGTSFEGDCGSPYIVLNTSFTKSIFAIHVAGAPGKMLGSVITQEYLKECLNLEFASQSGYVIDPLDETKINFPLPELTSGNIKLVGLANPPRVLPTRSKIRQSPLYGRFGEVAEAPAVLTPKTNPDGTIVHPLTNCLKQFDYPNVENFDKSLMCDVMDALEKTIPTLMEPRLLTWEEAANGVEGATYMRRIALSTSPGYPKNTIGAGKGKTPFFKVHDDGRLEYTEELMRECLDCEQKLMRGEVPDWIWSDNLKDERVAWRKIVNRETGEWICDTRVMSSGDLALLLTMRRYFGAYLENAMLNHLDGHMVLGINPHSFEWGFLKKKLGAWGFDIRNVLAGDFKKMDKTLCLYISMLVFVLVDRWYQRSLKTKNVRVPDDLKWKPSHETVRMTLHHVVHRSLHVMSNLIFQLEHGNPSGQLMTTDENSDAIAMMVVYIIIVELRKKGKYYTPSQVLQLVRMIILGDDHAIALHPDIVELISPQTFQKDFKEFFGMTYTSADKVSDLAYCTVNDVQFLCRSFKDNWMAPLEPGIVEGSLSYYKTSPELTVEQSMEAICRSALREYVHRGKAAFDEFKLRLKEECEDAGLVPVDMDFEDVFKDITDPNADSLPFFCQSGPAISGEHKEERQAVINPQDTQDTPTVTFGDNVGKQEANEYITSELKHRSTDPYPDQGLREVLERVYVINNLTWSGASAQGALIHEGTLPLDLYSVLNIQDKLDRFEYFRADTILNFRINSTPMHFGALLIAWCPHYTPSDNLNYTQSIYNMACLPHTILSANTGSTAEIKIPMVFPARYWNMKDASSAEAKGFFGRFWIKVLAPLRLVGGTTTPTIKVTITARFSNAQPAGLGLRSTQTALKRIISEYKAQSGEQERKSEKKTMASSLASAVKLGVEMLTTDASTMSVGDIAKMIGAFAKLADKPTDVSTITKVRLESNSGLALANGLDEVDLLAMDPENKVSQDAALYSDPIDYNLFSNYKLLPGLIALFTCTSAQAEGARIYSMPVHPMKCYTTGDGSYRYFEPTHIANLADKFTFWTGSLKFALACFGSNYTSMRLAIKWIPDPTFSGALQNDEFGDTVTHVVDVQGDTWYYFTIPYLRDRSWSETLTYQEVNTTPVTSWKGFNGQLVFQVLNPVVNFEAESTPQYFFALWMSGGEDFRVARPKPLPIDYVDGTVPFTAQSGELKSKAVDVTHDLREAFRRPFPSLIESTVLVQKNVTMGEEVSSWPELLRRYTMYTQQRVDNLPFRYAVAPYVPRINDMTFFSRVNRTFHFRRGSLRHKIYAMEARGGDSNPANSLTLLGTNFITPHDGADNDMTGVRGLALVDTRQRNFIEFQTPFYYDFDMVCSAKFLDEHVNLPYGSVSVRTANGILPAAFVDLFWYISVGDDWSFGWPCVPVALKQEILSDNNSTKKTSRNSSAH